MDGLSVSVECDCVAQDSGGKTTKIQGPQVVARHAGRYNGGEQGTRSGTHVPRSCDHCLRMEDDGRDRMCAPNPAADEVAGRPSGSSPLGLYTLKFVLFGRGSQDNEDVERSRLFLNGKAAGGR